MVIVMKVTGDLVLYELVVGEIAVEGIDNPVAIAPGVGEGFAVLGRAHAIAVAGHIKPVPSPAFPIVRRSQKAINYPGERVRGLVLEEGFDFLRGGREPNEGKVGATDQGALVRPGNWPNTAALHPGEDEGINGIEFFFPGFHDGQFRFLHGAESPVFAPEFLEIKTGSLVCNPGTVIGNGYAHVDPCSEVFDYRIGKFLLGWHLKILHLVVHSLDEEAFLRFARDDDCSAVATPENSCLAVEVEGGLQLLRFLRVAFVAVRGQYGPHVGFKVVQSFFARFVCILRECREGGCYHREGGDQGQGTADLRNHWKMPCNGPDGIGHQVVSYLLQGARSSESRYFMAASVRERTCSFS